MYVLVIEYGIDGDYSAPRVYGQYDSVDTVKIAAKEHANQAANILNNGQSEDSDYFFFYEELEDHDDNLIAHLANEETYHISYYCVELTTKIEGHPF